jgi:hypothetical protein
MDFFSKWFPIVDITCPIRKRALEAELVALGFDSKDALLGMIKEDIQELKVLPGDRSALRVAVARLRKSEGNDNSSRRCPVYNPSHNFAANFHIERPIMSNPTISASVPSSLVFGTINIVTPGAEPGGGCNSRTCFFVGYGFLKNSSDQTAHALWITARHKTNGHLPLTVGTKGYVRLSTTSASINVTCIYDCVVNDVAVFASANAPKDIVAHRFLHVLLMEHVVIAALGSDGATKVVGATVIEERASKFNEDESEIRCNRYFVLQHKADNDFTGAPIVNSMGYVVGMVSYSDIDGKALSYCLDSIFLVDMFEQLFSMSHHLTKRKAAAF